jgi:hypothetical protein
MPKVGHVDANLVGAAGFDAYAQKGGEGAGGQGFVAGDGVAAFFPDGHLLAMNGVPADGEFDGGG